MSIFILLFKAILVVCKGPEGTASSCLQVNLDINSFVYLTTIFRCVVMTSPSMEYRWSISSRGSSNSEASATELLES